MGTEQYTVGVVTRGRTESTIRFITYYANNVALWEAGKEAKLVSKNLRRRHSKRFMHERHARRTDSGKGLSAFKNPDVAGEGAKYQTNKTGVVENYI